MHQRACTPCRSTRLVPFAVVLAAALFVIGGCGRGDSGGKETTGDSESNGSEGRGAENDRQDGPFVDAEGRKWVAPGIPYDVWHQDPLSVASYEGGGEPDTTSTPTAEQGGSETETNPADTSAGGMNWKQIASGQVIDDEVKEINNRLRGNLRSMVTYNSSYLGLPPHINTMAAMAGVAVEHPDDIRWKEDAPYIRDLAAAMLKEKLMRGAKSYKAVNEPWLKINDILSGSPPAGVEEPAEANDFAEFADIALLMQRMEMGTKELNINAGSAEALKENADDIKHEALVIAVIGRVITHESYFYTDEVFDGFADELIGNCNKMVEATDAGDFDGFHTALSQAGQACDKCHNDYR